MEAEREREGKFGRGIKRKGIRGRKDKGNEGKGRRGVSL